jgi:hypothetical protein
MFFDFFLKVLKQLKKKFKNISNSNSILKRGPSLKIIKKKIQAGTTNNFEQSYIMYVQW